MLSWAQAWEKLFLSGVKWAAQTFLVDTLTALVTCFLMPVVVFRT